MRDTLPQTLTAVLEDEPTSLLALNPRLPLPLVWVVERCLVKEPAGRYASTRDLCRDLELAPQRLAEGAPGQRRGARSWLAVAAAVLGVAGVLGLSLAPERLKAPRGFPISRHLTYSGYDSSPAASPDGRTVAFSSQRDGQKRIWLVQVATGSEAPLTEGNDDHPRFSPDGASILFARTAGDRVSLFRIPSVGGDARRVVDDALYGDFSPDSRRICFVRQPSGPSWTTSVLATASVDGSEIRELATFDGRALVPPRWSQDGRTVALTRTTLQAGQHTVVVLVDVATGSTRSLPLPMQDNSPVGLAWAGARKLVYSQPDSVAGWATGSSSRILIHDIDSPTAEPVFSTTLGALALDVLGESEMVVGTSSFRVNLQELSLTEAPSVPRRRWLTRGNSSDRQPTYSPNDEWVAYSSNRGGNLDLWSVSRRSSAVRRLTDDIALDWDPSFTRDGRLLWSTNRTGHFEVWMAEADGTGARQVTRDGVDAENPSATSDGRWIVYRTPRHTCPYSWPTHRGSARLRRQWFRRTPLQRMPLAAGASDGAAPILLLEAPSTPPSQRTDSPNSPDRSGPPFPRVRRARRCSTPEQCDDGPPGARARLSILSRTVNSRAPRDRRDWS